MAPIDILLDRHRTIADKLARVNWPMIAVLAALALVGTVSLYSVAGGSLAPWAERHAVRFVLTSGLLLAIAVSPLELWTRLAYPAYLLALGLLALVPLIGTEALGARRWLQLGGLSVQPSELMKVALMLMLARYYQWLPAEKVSRPIYVALPFAAILAPVALTLRQPDLGTAALFAIVGISIMFMAGASWLYAVAGGLAAILAAPLIWGRLHDYQRRRVEIFLDPDRDPLGAGYHITQSKIALGSGGLTGRGYMQGTQSALDFLPEKHTDFIFTMFGEEWGFAGAMVVIAIYAIVLLMMAAMAHSCRSTFARLMISGAMVGMFVYASINIAMVTGLVPVVGVPLPLVSYGGTSMVSVMVGLGLAMCGYVHRDVVLLRRDLGRLW